MLFTFPKKIGLEALLGPNGTICFLGHGSISALGTGLVMRVQCLKLGDNYNGIVVGKVHIPYFNSVNLFYMPITQIGYRRSLAFNNIVIHVPDLITNVNLFLLCTVMADFFFLSVCSNTSKSLIEYATFKKLAELLCQCKSLLII